MKYLLMICLALCSSTSYAVIETYEFSAPELEARYQTLVEELRCPKCQNQTIADSNAPISEDLRRRLYQELEAGLSDDEIVAGMVLRYGEFVRYKPARTGVTLWLWWAPWILLLGGLFLWLGVVLRSRKARVSLGDKQDQIEKLLKDNT